MGGASNRVPSRLTKFDRRGLDDFGGSVIGLSNCDVRVTPLAHSFCSQEIVEETCETILRSIRASLGRPSAGIRIFVCDSAGRLRLLAAARGAPAGSEAGRKAVLRSGKPRYWSAEAGTEMAALPLTWQDHNFGVVEVRWSGDKECDAAVLETAADQAAALLQHARARTEMQRARDILKRIVDLARRLVTARTAQAAVDETVKLLHDQLRVPVAAWLGSDGAQSLEFAGSLGLGAAARLDLEERLPVVSRWRSLKPRGRKSLEAGFAAATGAEDVAVVDAGDAVLLVAGASALLRGCLDSTGEMLRDVLQHLHEVSQARKRNEQFDFGIAMTAHELRGPILGTKAMLEHLIMSTGHNDRQLALLNRSTKELKQLYDMVEGLLRWAVEGTESAGFKLTPVADVVTQAIATCGYETGDDRIRFTGRAPVTVLADPGQLRIAIANLVRNALFYSPKDTAVHVSVDHRDAWATIKVHDSGPGISAEEGDDLFDPFVRGSMGRSSRSGKGLGLFIARRIIEAHAGTIWLQSTTAGTTFFVQLPAVPASPRITSLNKQEVAS